MAYSHSCIHELLVKAQEKQSRSIFRRAKRFGKSEMYRVPERRLRGLKP
jgi:hypothetical protein